MNEKDTEPHVLVNAGQENRFHSELVSCPGRLRHQAIEETLSCSRLPQGVIPIQVRRLPAAEPLGIEHGTVFRIVVAHPGTGISKLLLQ